MKNIVCILIVWIGIFSSCDCDCDGGTSKTYSALEVIEKTKYFDSEIFTLDYLKVYGKWQLFDISGGLDGLGYEPNFDFLEIKKYGIYDFVRQDSLLEYGKIMPALQTASEMRLKVDLVEDEYSGSFLSDKEKYVEFSGNVTLYLSSPCCDRYMYHFKRVK